MLTKLYQAILSATKDAKVRDNLEKVCLPAIYKSGKELDELADEFGAFQYKTLKDLGVL